MITRFYRRLRRDRNLFHRRHIAGQRPRPKRSGLRSIFGRPARPFARPACTGAVIRGGRRHGGRLRLPPRPLSVSAEVRPEDIADLSADLSADPSTNLSAHISADLIAYVIADLSAEAVRLDFCGVNHVELLPRIHMFRGARASAA